MAISLHQSKKLGKSLYDNEVRPKNKSQDFCDFILMNKKLTKCFFLLNT